MKKLLFIAFLLTLQFGCSHFKMAAVNGHVNVVFKSHEKAYEKDMWDFVTDKFGVAQSEVVQPTTHSAKGHFVQEAYNTLELSRRERVAKQTGCPVSTEPIKKVQGFYDQSSNLVLYIIGEFPILVHEYCHALNYQLKLNLSAQQDEYFCERVEADYHERQEMQRLKQENKFLRRELNKRRF